MSSVTLAEQSAASTPSSGNAVIYFKTDGLMYWKDDTGTEYPVAYGGGAGTFADLTVTGNTILGNASGDTFTINAAAWTLGNAATVTGTWTNLGTVTTVDINGGTIDGTAIGGSSAAAGSFTTLSASGTITASGGTITTGSGVTLSLSTSGGVQFDVADTPSATNNWRATGSNGGAVNFFAVGASSNINGGFYSKGSGGVVFGSNSGVTQFQVNHTASADRFVIVTGSNGGNPSVTVSGGELAVGTNSWTFGTANVVSPTSPNRTLTVTIGGTTYYIAAKTTND